ncbi:hypothetical protein ACFLSQ_02130 [Bacteroidota bacterium]
MSKLKKKVLVLFLCLSLFTLQGCPECIEPKLPDGSDSDIIFTGISLNSDFPGIFTVNEDGSILVEHIENAAMFSPFSRDNYIVFLGKDGMEEDSLFRSHLSQMDKKYPKFEPGIFPRYPVISPDGKYTALFSGGDTGEDTLIIGTETQGWKQWAYEICPKTVPVFSPDGKYLAFYEGDSLEAPLRINIVSSDNPGNLYDFRELSFGIIGLRGEAILNWQHQDTIAYSFSREANLDSIGIWNLKNEENSFTIKAEYEGAYNPIISPDGTKIVITDRKGDLWQSRLSSDSLFINWEQLVATDEQEYILYPSWSADNKKILYTKFFKNNSNPYSGNLEILDVKTEKSRIVCNNVSRAFWMDK